MHRAAATQAVGEVRHTAGIDGDASEPIALVVVDRSQRAVDRQFVEVRSDPAQLGVDVGEETALEQRVVVKSMPGTT
jgi:hypothetical protein